MAPKTAFRPARESGPSGASIAIFDMGGVLLDWNPRHLYRKLIPTPTKWSVSWPTVTTRQWHEVQDHGGDPAGGDPAPAVS